MKDFLSRVIRARILAPSMMIIMVLAIACGSEGSTALAVITPTPDAAGPGAATDTPGGATTDTTPPTKPPDTITPDRGGVKLPTATPVVVREGTTYADQVLRYVPATERGTSLPDANNPTRALGPPDGQSVSLGGNGGVLEVKFVNNVMVNGPGNDLKIVGCGPGCLPFSGDEAYDVFVLVGSSFQLLGSGPGTLAFDLDSINVEGPVTNVRIVDQSPAGFTTPGLEIDAIEVFYSTSP